ncbi:uncharacterized protein LOC116584108, partial [Mustela erminea]|uniref:uncharacterized protein LOC116584108 n=1 Tax=Mustela erminea TaxID=36723 RepID=UPI001386C313
GALKRDPLPREPQQGAGQVAALGLGCAEEAASRARGGGRGGPGITWAEAGLGAPGGLSPESGRQRRWRRRQWRCLLTLPPSLPSRLWPSSPTGEREPGERELASPGGRCPLRAGLSRSRALLLQHPARGYLGLGVQKAPGLGELGQRAGHIPEARGAEFISRLKGLRIQSLCEPRASAWGPGDLGQGQGLGLGKRRSQGP